MAENSKIEWTDHTANLWWGCTKVHAGCDHCYAEFLSETRKGKGVWGNDKPRAAVKSVWKDLEKYQKKAKEAGEIHRVFVGSMMDIFEKPMPLVDWNGNQLTHGEGSKIPLTTFTLRAKLLQEIEMGKYPNLMFLLLTKRPSNINKYIPQQWLAFPPKNVMFGTSVSDQETADTLIPQLMQVNGFKFLSVEPQLNELSLVEYGMWEKQKGSIKTSFPIHWIIVGGESGPNKRPFNCDWARKLKAECATFSVPFFMKQVDKVQPIPDDLLIREFPKL